MAVAVRAEPLLKVGASTGTNSLERREVVGPGERHGGIGIAQEASLDRIGNGQQRLDSSGKRDTVHDARAADSVITLEDSGSLRIRVRSDAVARDAAG